MHKGHLIAFLQDALLAPATNASFQMLMELRYYYLLLLLLYEDL